MEIKKKLLVFHPAIAPYRIDLFNKLNQAYNARFFFYRRNFENQQFDQDLLQKSLNFKPHFLDFGFSLGYKDRVFRFGILFKILKQKPDLILCSEYSLTTIFSLFWSKLLLPKSRIFTICDDSLDIAVECRGIRKIARRIVTKFIDGIVLCNTPVENWYKANYPRLNTFIFPIIQDEKRLQSLLPKIKLISDRICTREGIHDKKIYLYVGRFAPEKNLAFLINAFATYLKSTQDNAMLFLIGDGMLKSDMIALAKDLHVQNEVKFPGTFDGVNLYAWYHLADYFVLASTYEPFGAVVNEALIFNLPVICAEPAGSAYLINAHNGLLFNPYNATELVAIFKQFSFHRSHTRHLMPVLFEHEVSKLMAFLS